LRRFITLLTTVVVVALAGPPAWASGWRQNDFDAGKTRYNPNETTLTSQTVADVQLAWEADLSAYGGVKPLHTGPPIVAHGVLYVGGEHRLWALDAGTGSTVWDREMGCSVANGVASGVLLVSSCTDGLFGLDAVTGQTLWSRPQFPLFDTAFSRGAVYGFFVRTGTPRRLKLAKFDVETGAILWAKRVPLTFIDLSSQPASLALDRGTVFISNGLGAGFTADRGRLFGKRQWMAFDAASGENLGRMGCRNAQSGLENEALCVMDAASGELLWSTSGEEVSGPAVTRSSVITSGGSRDIETGGFQFGVPATCESALFDKWCRPLVAGDVIYMYDDRSPEVGLTAYDASSGQLVAELDVRSTQFIVANGSIFATVVDGVQAWRLP
jgi:outer membrane protein assembly factor BamB